MSQTLINGVILIVVVVWFGARRLRWTPMDFSRMLRLPVILGVVGVITVLPTMQKASLSTLDVSVLIVELVAAVAFGAATGAVTQFRPMTAAAIAAHVEKQDPAKRGNAELVTHESRTPWIGMVLWLLFIGIRVGLGFWSSTDGSTLGTSTGVILVLLALNRGTAALVVRARMEGLPALARR
jgi:hypothetical protein